MASLLRSRLREWGFLVFFAAMGGVEAFAWSISKHPRPNPAEAGGDNFNPVEASQAGTRLSNVYNIALNELQELESEPLCHRIAARLLVNNCQLLDGQDEATVLTDSGRAARDFVDSYAASLAICDLERGSFMIPSSCARFRESTLAAISVPSKPQLHVSTPEIDNCLEGLAQSDSAWNTWVSYRHKALRFCEAARADNEKDQNIHMYQRVTKIMEKLTTQVQDELESRMHSLDKVVHDTATGLESLGAHVDHLRDGLSGLDSKISEKLSQTAEESADIIRGGLDDATNLQRLLAVLVETAMDRTAEVSSSHESSLQVATKQLNNEVSVIMATLAATVVSSASLHKEIDNSQYRVSEVARKQEKIEASMERLEGFAQTLSIEHASHQESLEEARKTASQLSNTLEFASTSAAALGASISTKLGFGGWWPYFLCPAASLVMGSYGLPPSAGRNLLLISLGEVAGVAISFAHQYMGVLFPELATEPAEGHQQNVTSHSRIPDYLSSDFISQADLHRAKFIRH